MVGEAGEVIGGGGCSGEVVVVVVGRAEIDTRAPFRSVKEAVALFGERVLAGELSAGRRGPLSSVTETTRSSIAQNRVAATRPKHHAKSPATGAVTTAALRAVPPVVVTADQLEEAKQKLEKEREEKQKMAGCIQTLQEELSHAMEELKRLKARDDEEAAGTKVIDLEIDEGLYFTEAAEKQMAPPPQGAAGGAGELQKKRYVTFADPPTVAATAAAACRAPPLPDVVMEVHRAPPHQLHQPHPHYYREPRFQRQMSAGHEAANAMADEGRKKKKPLIPLVGALFMRRKKSSKSCHDDVAF